MAWAVNRPAAGTAYSLPTRLFPSDNWWNLRVDTAPVAAESATIMAAWSGSLTLNYDWGNNYGMPYCTVSGDYPKVYFTHISYSGLASGDDARGYPIPVEALTVAGWTEDLEGTIDVPVSTGDRHLLIFDVDNQHLYEIYQPFHNATAAPVAYREFTVQPGEYACASCSFWDTKTNNVRPLDVTSSDAAGLQILPGLAKYDEAIGDGPITHAQRICINWTGAATPRYVWPATHYAPGGVNGLYFHPMGTRFRLKASHDFSWADPWPYSKKLLESWRDYGVIFADNGTSDSRPQITGTNDTRWGAYDSQYRAQASYAVIYTPWSAFEVVELGWTPTVTLSRLRLASLALEAPDVPYQYARPTADLDAGTWTPSTGSTLSPTLDEIALDDTDYITSTGSGTESAVVRLRGANRPVAGTCRLRVRAKRG